MNLIKWSMLLPSFCLTCALVGCSDSAENTVLPADPAAEVDASYEDDSYGNASDESAN